MPPVLNPTDSKRDGLAFLGISLSRQTPAGHPASKTNQTSFDFNSLQDRDYMYVQSTNDDGWLVGGGEPGPPTAYKLAKEDSGHIEVLRIGTFVLEWGGISEDEIISVLNSGQILIPKITLLPTALIANPDSPPELEIRFDMSPPPNFADPTAELPVNWELRFVHNQLFKHFVFPSRFCPGPFHSTIARKVEFRSDEQEKAYFAKCNEIIDKWKEDGPKPLMNNGILKENGEYNEFNEDGEVNEGICLFLDRNNIIAFFKPNFLPPYDAKEKRDVILEVLKEEWDEKTLSWKRCW